jgi:phosphate starvation-inducible protein PhoH
MNIFKSVITRIGEHSKMIFLGDCEQVDFRSDKKKQQSALQYITKIFSEEDYVGVIEFGPEDCVRNPIIPKVLDKLRDFESNNTI